MAACSSKPDKPIAKIVQEQSQQTKEKQVICWTGRINNNIPVFLQYTFQDKVIVGEITYLNTKDKKPIKIIGTIEEDTSYTLLEFTPDGNNTGIITGKPQDQSFQGSWFSPQTQNQRQLTLTKKDTVLHVPDLLPATAKIAGKYHYKFSEQGYQGSLQVNKLEDNSIAFSIFSVTEAPQRNIAQVSTDTVTMSNNSFSYLIPESDSCEFKVTFYQGFATVDYTKGYCQDQFGLNATIDGVFIKVK